MLTIKLRIYQAAIRIILDETPNLLISICDKTVYTPYNLPLLKTKILQKYSSHIAECRRFKICVVAQILWRANNCRKIETQKLLEAKLSILTC
jgi:hypothetical protein